MHELLVPLRPDFLGQEVDFIGDRPHRDRGVDRNRQIVRRQRIHFFSKAFPSRVVDQDIIPRRPPVDSFLKRFFR